MDETLDDIVERKLEDIRYGKEFWMALCHKSWRTLEAIMAVSMNFLSRDKEVQDGRHNEWHFGGHDGGSNRGQDILDNLLEEKNYW